MQPGLPERNSLLSSGRSMGANQDPANVASGFSPGVRAWKSPERSLDAKRLVRGDSSGPEKSAGCSVHWHRPSLQHPGRSGSAEIASGRSHRALVLRPSPGVCHCGWHVSFGKLAHPGAESVPSPGLCFLRPGGRPGSLYAGPSRGVWPYLLHDDVDSVGIGGTRRGRAARSGNAARAFR